MRSAFSGLGEANGEPLVVEVDDGVEVLGEAGDVEAFTVFKRDGVYLSRADVRPVERELFRQDRGDDRHVHARAVVGRLVRSERRASDRTGHGDRLRLRSATTTGCDSWVGYIRRWSAAAK